LKKKKEKWQLFGIDWIVLIMLGYWVPGGRSYCSSFSTVFK